MKKLFEFRKLCLTVICIFTLFISSYSRAYAVDFSILLGKWDMSSQGISLGKPSEFHPTLTFTEVGSNSAIGQNQIGTPIVATWDAMNGQFKLSFTGSDMVYFVNIIDKTMTGYAPELLDEGDFIVSGTKQDEDGDMHCSETTKTKFSSDTNTLCIPIVDVDGLDYWAEMIMNDDGSFSLKDLGEK